jgi:RsiW-degrading membrane proteinase PrsW (M82 family)
MFRENRITKHHEVSEDLAHWAPLARKDLQTQQSAGVGPERGDGVLPAREAEGPYIRPGTSALDSDEAVDLSSPDALVGTIFKNGSTPWILAFGIGPLVFVFLQSLLGLRFVHTAWLFSAYFCVLWAWILGTLIDGGRTMWRRGVVYAVFTAFIGVLMLLAWQTIPMIAILYSGTETMNPLSRLLGFVLGVGVFEELCKVAPLLLFGLQARTIRSGGDGLFLGMMSGLGFAVSEGVEYTIKYWSSAVGLGEAHVRQCVEQATNLHGGVNQDVFLERLSDALPIMFEQYGLFVVAQLTRFMSLPLLHAAWAGLVGYGAAKAFREGHWGLLFAGLGVAAVLHGLYNFYSPGVLSLVVAALSISLTLALIVREARIGRVAA